MDRYRPICPCCFQIMWKDRDGVFFVCQNCQTKIIRLPNCDIRPLYRQATFKGIRPEKA